MSNRCPRQDYDVLRGRIKFYALRLARDGRHVSLSTLHLAGLRGSSNRISTILEDMIESGEIPTKHLHPKRLEQPPKIRDDDNADEPPKRSREAIDARIKVHRETCIAKPPQLKPRRSRVLVDRLRGQYARAMQDLFGDTWRDLYRSIVA